MNDQISENLSYTPSFPIVGIGASAGGLDAYKRFLQVMPADSGLAYVLVQHLDPTHESLMAELLGRCTEMPVTQAVDGQRVEPNRVYMIPPNRSLTIHRGRLHLAEPIERRGIRIAIDTFFRTLADDQRECAVGVVLSGTGSDGTDGLKAIKAIGGLTLAQEPSTAAHDGMPQSAINAAVVDQVCTIEQMPELLVRYADHPHVNGNRHNRPPLLPADNAEADLSAVLTLLLTRGGVDFRHYKRATLARRIERRMGLNHVDQAVEYLALLRDQPVEVNRLKQDLMIGVTAFFRDDEVWTSLAERVLRPLIANAAPQDTLRLWVPGCATGEEAYTLAMLLHEQQRAQDKRVAVQIFASDIDDAALEIARNGQYPAGSAASLSAERLETFFDQDDQHRLTIKKALRESVVFARQNLIADPPFSRLDLISCRNLLIYLQQPVQDKLIGLFHFALRAGGALLLGSSESVGQYTELFEPIDKPLRLYRRAAIAASQMPTLGLTAVDASPARADGGPADASRGRPRLADLASRWVLEAYAPATVIVNRHYEALFFCGPVGRYLDYPYGEAKLNLFDIARDGLTTRLRGAVQGAFERNEPVTVNRARMRQDGRYQSVRLEVRPLKGQPQAGDNLAMVSFSDVETPAAASGGGGDETYDESATLSADEGLVNQLEDELRATKQDLQTTIEEMETSNEELKASNEEVMSINEELQSANEELETSKEELQSLNEELTTVNSQLQDKVSELEQAGNDISNLLNSTDIATLFLDPKLRIKRFTPAATQLFRLIASDVGRPLADLASRIDDPTLLGDAGRVLQRLVPVEAEVESGGDGGRRRWFTRRVLPYRTHDDKIDGVVVTFSDVTRLRDSEKTAGERLAQLETVYRETPVGLCFHDRELRYGLINDYLSQVHNSPVEAHIGRTPRELLPTPLAERIETILRQVLDSGKAQTDVTLRVETPDRPGLLRDWQGNFCPVSTATGETIGVNVMLQEVTEQKMAERCAATERAIARALVAGKTFSTTLRDVLNAFSEVFGIDLGEFWVPIDNDPPRFACEMFCIPQAPADVETQTQRIFDDTVLTVDDSLIGQAWTRRRVLRVDDFASATRFKRAPQARQLALATAFAVPVGGAGDDEPPFGVISLFSRERLPDDPALLDMFGRLGRDLGEFRRRIDAERAAAEREREYKTLADHLPNIISRFDRSYRHLYVNPAVTAVTGLAPEAFVGKTHRELAMPDALCAQWERLIDRAFAEQGDVQDEFAFDTPDGRRYYYSRLTPERDEQGRITNLLRVSTDITARRRIEAALAEREQRLERALQEIDTLYRNAPVGLVVLDREQRIVKINDHLARLGERSADELVGQRVAVLFPALAETVGPIVQRVLDSGEPAFDQEIAAVVDGENRPRYWRVSYVPLSISSGVVNTVNGTVMEITRLKRIENELRNASRKADAANRSKSEFLANMSHEIRSPLTAILGYADLLAARVRDSNDLAGIKTIRQNGQHLLSLLNDFLDLAKIEAGKLNVETRPVAVDQLVGEVHSLIAVRADEKNLTFNIAYATAMPSMVVTDPVRLRQILINLLSNAIKFTDAGGVRLVGHFETAGDERPPQLRFDVIDTGIGMTRTQQNTLFQAFTQADSSVTRRFGGTGLGLDISQRLAALLGGSISATSEIGKGSVFSVTITAAPAADSVMLPAGENAAIADADADPASWPALGGLLLVVDDRPDIRTLVQQCLERAGARVVTAADGESALATVARMSAPEGSQRQPDAVVMDMQMPRLDGYETVRRLRAGGFDRPVIALTAAALTGARELCLAAGCTDYLSKPINPRQLIETIARHIAPADAAAAATPPADGRVLLVDDSVDALQATAQLLRLSGFDVATAVDGESALAAARAGPLSAVVLDIELPDTDGYTLSKTLRALPACQKAVFIVLSGHPQESGEAANETAAIDHYLVKPPDLNQLKSLLLGRRHAPEP